MTQPRAYTPKHLAERILRSRAALEGERKQVTVLFVDVKDSMRLAASVDPEEWHRILDRFFALLADGVHRFEGTINQYTGDGVMALFGAPLALEDHAERPVRAPTQARGREFARREGETASASRRAWASTRATSWSARSATTCAWTTPRKGTRSGSRSACRRARLGRAYHLPDRRAGARLLELERGALRLKGVREPVRIPLVAPGRRSRLVGGALAASSRHGARAAAEDGQVVGVVARRASARAGSVGRRSSAGARRAGDRGAHCPAQPRPALRRCATWCAACSRSLRRRLRGRRAARARALRRATTTSRSCSSCRPRGPRARARPRRARAATAVRARMRARAVAERPTAIALDDVQDRRRERGVPGAARRCRGLTRNSWC
jgi:hypothetical protein